MLPLPFQQHIKFCMSFFSLKVQNPISFGCLHAISFIHSLYCIVCVVFCSYFNSLYLHIVHWVEVIKIGYNLHICLLCSHIVNLVLLHVVIMEQWLKTSTIICRLSLRTMKKNNWYLMLHLTFNLKVEASIKVAKINFSANSLKEWENGCGNMARLLCDDLFSNNCFFKQQY